MFPFLPGRYLSEKIVNVSQFEQVITVMIYKIKRLKCLVKNILHICRLYVLTGHKYIFVCAKGTNNVHF